MSIFLELGRKPSMNKCKILIEILYLLLFNTSMIKMNVPILTSCHVSFRILSSISRHCPCTFFLPRKILKKLRQNAFIHFQINATKSFFLNFNFESRKCGILWICFVVFLPLRTAFPFASTSTLPYLPVQKLLLCSVIFITYRNTPLR